MQRYANSADCPFELNRDRFDEGGRDSRWDGGIYFEVFVGGRNHEDMESEAMMHFWESDRTVEVDFEGRTFEFAENACDENVTPLIEQVRSDAFSIVVRPGSLLMTEGRFGCAVKVLEYGGKQSALARAAAPPL